MSKFAGFCYESGGLIAVQVVKETPRGWDGVGGHLSSNQWWAEQDAIYIVNKHAAPDDGWEWAGLMETQDAMRAFEATHPPKAQR